MTIKKCNWKTDLQLAETFYTFSENNTLIATPIPDDAIDFQIVYRAEHDSRYTVSRTHGVYKGCKKINENTLAVFIPLSRYPLGRGPLLRELYMRVPNNDFEGKIRNICVPADTKHFLWDGPNDYDGVVSTEIITATILKGNTGDSAYEDAVQHGYLGTEEQYAKWPITQGNYAKEQAENALEASKLAFQAKDEAFAAAVAATNAATAANDGAAAAQDVVESYDNTIDVLAHSDCTLDARVASLERLLTDVLAGRAYIPELQVRRLGVWGACSLVLTGEGAPAKAPDKAGQFYIDTASRALYYAAGNTAVADWKIA